VRQEMGNVARSDGGYDRFSPMVNPVVQVPIQLFFICCQLKLAAQGRKTTHDDKLMIKNHRSVTPSHIREWLFRRRKNSPLLQYPSNVGISPSDGVLASRKMAVDKTERRVAHNESCNDGTLRCNDRNQVLKNQN
jgi:hypothetical protein